MMPNNARYFEVSPIHPRVMVGHRCGCLLFVDASFVELDGSRWGWAVDVESGSANLQVFLSRITLCEVFGRVIEVLHMWQCLLTDLKISSQAIEYLVLGDCKGASPGGNKVNFLTEPLVSTKGKILVYNLLLLQLERFEDVLLNFAPYCAAKHQVYLGTSSDM
jgi:hypothetical protein